MGLYERFVLPHLVHLTCRQKPQRLQRRKIVPLARGEVLEIGFGSGLNLPFYDPARVRRIHALEPSPEMWELARPAVAASPLRVEHLRAPAEEIPLADGSAETVVVTYTLCTVADVAAALGEIRRVLGSSGRLLFCEHGEAPDAGVRRWQRRLDPLWSRLAGGCHLDRPIAEIVRRASFEIERLETMYVPGWRPASFNYWGSARPRAES